MDETTQVGPLATPDILEGLNAQVRRSVALGARLLTGGRKPGAARELLCAHGAGRCPGRFARRSARRCSARWPRSSA